jgi:phage-related baseplate assembly protein
VDPIPYVASVQNVDKSDGGADIEPDDDGVNVWSGYRERIRQAPSGFSTAGPADGYAYWAKTADVNIQDIAVLFPSPGAVNIVVLMKDGELPTEAILEAVASACNDRKRRPLTDNVSVSAPVTVTYNINFTYYISNNNATDEAIIRNAIENAGGAVDQYNAWQAGKLGQAINPDYLRGLILIAGASRIDLTSPVYTEVDIDKVASIGTVNVTYGGLI